MSEGECSVRIRQNSGAAPSLNRKCRLLFFCNSRIAIALLPWILADAPGTEFLPNRFLRANRRADIILTARRYRARAKPCAAMIQAATEYGRPSVTRDAALRLVREVPTFTVGT